jgi:hypothetical protein
MRRHAAWYIQRADVVELVDTHALGACAERREGSSPFIRTIQIVTNVAFFILKLIEWIKLLNTTKWNIQFLRKNNIHRVRLLETW